MFERTKDTSIAE